MFVSLQNLYVGILTPKGDDISRWGLWEMLKYEGGTLMNGTSAL